MRPAHGRPRISATSCGSLHPARCQFFSTFLGCHATSRRQRRRWWRWRPRHLTQRPHQQHDWPSPAPALSGAQQTVPLFIAGITTDTYICVNTWRLSLRSGTNSLNQSRQSTSDIDIYLISDHRFSPCYNDWCRALLVCAAECSALKNGKRSCVLHPQMYPQSDACLQHCNVSRRSHISTGRQTHSLNKTINLQWKSIPKLAVADNNVFRHVIFLSRSEVTPITYWYGLGNRASVRVRFYGYV